MKNIIKQRHIPHIGSLYEVFTTALPILSGVNFVSIIIILYANIQPFLTEYLPWMTITHFIAILTIAFIIGAILVYKFLLPSLWSFRGEQMFGYQSEVNDKLDKIIERLDKLEKG